jgi:hypothetical protein
MRNTLLLSSAIALLGATSVQAQTPTAEEMWAIIQQQQAEIARLKSMVEDSSTRIQETEIMVSATADAVEAISVNGGGSSQLAQWAEKTTLGGYGEHHYNHTENKDDQVDAHRFVVFMGHQFSDTVKLFSEVEIEHGLVEDTDDGTGPGEVELEQAYIQWDFTDNHSLVLGQYLLPVGIINETHEPDTFYGTERNRVESNIIPATWWETGIMVQGEILPGLSYNAAIHSGLNLDEPAGVRGGRQKSAKAVAEDPAYTFRLKYTGVPGLEVASSIQYQSDMTQGSGGFSEGGSAMLYEAHAIYNTGPFGIRALWASWDIDNDDFELEGFDKQDGWYVEPSYKLTEKLGIFARYSEYNNKAGLSSSTDYEIWDYGVNFWLHPRVVLKADYSDVVEGDTDHDSFNLGLGWSF